MSTSFICYTFKQKTFKESPLYWTATKNGASVSVDSRLKFSNCAEIKVNATGGTQVPMGLWISASHGFPLILHGVCTNPDIVCHTGLIDPSYTGELSIILANSRHTECTVAPDDLTVFLLPFGHTTPVISDDCTVLKPPAYQDDAGFDLVLETNVTIAPKTVHEITSDMSFLRGIDHGKYSPMLIGRSGLACRGILIYPSKVQDGKASVKIINLTKEVVILRGGTRFCQLIFVKKSHIPSIIHTLKTGQGSFLVKAPNISFLKVACPDETCPNSSKVDTFEFLANCPAVKGFSCAPPAGEQSFPAPVCKIRHSKGFGSSGD
ncbi:dUTPase [Cricetid gammaherpesvirus 2]|uniref:dUTPase n=1 Tax=Cricetid gammaherpesvirus 2 TaxID=1605972 RepID=E9M5N7_9GAMA|nr:dUTPase [Cricetid gammaherpesvirus 2]ADW24395.1 dUTPase [Cricetid gammaherpesvirus 2]ADW24477.1 dUTPase [Cricetid gammaherpesvirus 2]